MKKFFKGIMRIFKIGLCILIFCAGVFVAQAWHQYEQIKSTYPIEDIKEMLQAHTKNYVEYEDISPYLIDATIAIEDRRYFDRYGVDYIALARATIINLLAMDVVQGGSTIEQQFIKIYYFKYDRSLTNKLIEIFFIYDLDNYYSKETMIELYLNIINYGDNNIGVGAAAKNYFGKDARDLTLYEASLIAGIPNSPANYQLSNNNPKTYERQRKILKNMLELQMISEAEYYQGLNNQEVFNAFC